MLKCERCKSVFEASEARTRIDYVIGNEGYPYSVCPKCGHGDIKAFRADDSMGDLINLEMDDMWKHYGHSREFIEEVNAWLEKRW